MDFFAVPTLTFKFLYCFFVIEHGRLREAVPDAGPYRYMILDHDSKFSDDLITVLKATGLQPKRTSVQAPWQNGIAERWVGSCRREILDHVIALDERHLRRLVRDYVDYHHEDRIHDALGKDTPDRRRVEKQSLRRLQHYYPVLV